MCLHETPIGNCTVELTFATKQTVDWDAGDTTQGRTLWFHRSLRHCLSHCLNHEIHGMCATQLPVPFLGVNVTSHTNFLKHFVQ